MSTPAPHTPRGLGDVLRDLGRAWFELTSEEQHAVLIILGLLLLGVAARFWHTI